MNIHEYHRNRGDIVNWDDIFCVVNDWTGVFEGVEVSSDEEKHLSQDIMFLLLSPRDYAINPPQNTQKNMEKGPIVSFWIGIVDVWIFWVHF